VVGRGRIEHVGIDVHDLDSVVGFLEQAFDLVVERSVTLPGKVRTAVLRWGEVSVELMERLDDRHASEREYRIDHLAIRVDDVAAEVSRLHEAGVVTETPEPEDRGRGPTIFIDGQSHGIRLQLVT